MILERQSDTKTKIPQEKLVEDILLVGIASGQAPTTTFYNDEGRFHARSGRRKFGSWEGTLGAVCSEVFDFRPPIEYMAHLLEEFEEEEDMAITAGRFYDKTGVQLLQGEIDAIRCEAGMKDSKIDEGDAVEDFVEYVNENNGLVGKSTGRGFIRGMSEMFNVSSYQYLRHFSTLSEAERKAGYRQIHELNSKRGRGSKQKLDDFIRVANLSKSGVPIEDLPVSAATLSEIEVKIRKNLPERFFNEEI